jgi:Protein of unknown function (DUF1579)
MRVFMTISQTRLLAALLAVALLTGADDPPQKKGDSQSTYEPKSSPGAGQKLLEQFAGDWDVEKTFYPQTGTPVRASGECHQMMMHEGRFLRSEFVFNQGGTKSTGLGIIGFDPESGAFTSVWTDSRSTRMSMRQSEDRFNGEEIVLYSQSLNTGGKESRRSRTVTRLEQGGRQLLHRQYVPGADGKERLMMELVMTRKPPAAAPASPR